MESPFAHITDKLTESRLLKAALVATATIGLTIGLSGCNNVHATDCGKFILHAEGAQPTPKQPCPNTHDQADI